MKKVKIIGCSDNDGYWYADYVGSSFTVYKEDEMFAFAEFECMPVVKLDCIVFDLPDGWEVVETGTFADRSEKLQRISRGSKNMQEFEVLSGLGYKVSENEVIIRKIEEKNTLVAIPGLKEWKHQQQEKNMPPEEDKCGCVFDDEGQPVAICVDCRIHGIQSDYVGEEINQKQEQPEIKETVITPEEAIDALIELCEKPFMPPKEVVAINLAIEALNRMKVEDNKPRKFIVTSRHNLNSNDGILTCFDLAEAKVKAEEYAKEEHEPQCVIELHGVCTPKVEVSWEI